jgi:hypothetical protein
MSIRWRHGKEEPGQWELASTMAKREEPLRRRPLPWSASLGTDEAPAGGRLLCQHRAATGGPEGCRFLHCYVPPLGLRSLQREDKGKERGEWGEARRRGAASPVAGGAPAGAGLPPPAAMGRQQQRVGRESTELGFRPGQRVWSFLISPIWPDVRPIKIRRPAASGAGAGRPWVVSGWACRASGG